MNNMTEQNQEMAASHPMLELVDTYSKCLAVSQDYEAEVLTEAKETQDDDLDINSLENFLSIREDLFALAESNLESLGDNPSSNETNPAHQELTKRTLLILEEMAEIENRLTTFLGARLSKMKNTISRMKESQPVFKRYANIGNWRNTNPNRITRLE